MKVGDILECLAAAAFTVAVTLATQQLWPAFVVAGTFFAYEAQCVSTHPVKLPRPRLPKWLKTPTGSEAEF